MTTWVTIYSKKRFRPDEFLDYADIPGLQLFCCNEEDNDWFFARENLSTTLFLLQREEDGYELHVDNLAAYDDLRFFPYLADTLTKFLGGEIAEAAGESIYRIFDEEWVTDTISEEIAMLKATLSIVPQYFPALPMM